MLILTIACFIGGIMLVIACVLLAKDSDLENEPAEGVDNKRRRGNVWTAYASSIIGSRSMQQDSYRIPSENVSAFARRLSGELMVLCDGMGGMQGGELASRICADTVLQGFYAGQYIADPQAFFRAALAKADTVISALTDADGRSLRSGTTCVAALIRGDKLYWASAGDSRIYLYSAGRLRQITRDHNYSLTLLQRVAAGEITQAQALNDPQRDALISYVGKGKIAIIDTGVEQLSYARGDAVILCSDGLYRALSEQEIAAVLQKHRWNPDSVPDAMTTESASKTWMKHDNTTVIVAL